MDAMDATPFIVRIIIEEIVIWTIATKHLISVRSHVRRNSQFQFTLIQSILSKSIQWNLCFGWNRSVIPFILALHSKNETAQFHNGSVQQVQQVQQFQFLLLSILSLVPKLLAPGWLAMHKIIAAV